MGSRLPARVGAALGAVALVALSAPAASAGQDDQPWSAYATGTVLHAEALETPTLQDPTSTRVLDVDEAFSGATADSQGLAEAQTNELGGTVQPAQSGKKSYGRGFGLDVSVAQTGQDQGQLTLAGLAEAAAPPQEGPTKQEIPLDVDPIAYSATLKGEAFADWATAGVPCVLGGDTSYGLGYAEKLELLDLAGEAEEEEGLEAPLLSTNVAADDRSVSWSVSRTTLSPQLNENMQLAGDKVGVVAETRQTIAPVSILTNAGAPVPEFLTIEFLGEWVLRAHAGGVPGSAFIHYGPGEVSPETPLLRIISPGEEAETILSAQDLLGEEGLVIQIPTEGEDLLLELAVGEDPRAIGGNADSQPQIAADGTSAAAAVDVLRVKLLSLPGTGEAAELRFGHMEVAATAPPGGIDCQIPVQKTARTPVNAGETFDYTITVTNPFDCTLRDVRVEDTISADPGIVWTVTATNPQADTQSDTNIVWNDVGDLAPGASKTLTITVQVAANSGGGVMHDVANVTAVCDDEPAAGEDDAFFGVNVPVTGNVRVDLPDVIQVGAGQAAPDLPRTGAPSLLTLAGLSLAGTAMLLRRRR
ncbi:MAG TPA: DUF11 domain-containing protein [Nitriliruptorales bacterium]|nr:DUF11 domain-containing protein [Nitriliruptorales bacterium]